MSSSLSPDLHLPSLPSTPHSLDVTRVPMSSLLQGIRNGSCLSSNAPNTFSVMQLSSAECRGPAKSLSTHLSRPWQGHSPSSLPLCLYPGRTDNYLQQPGEQAEGTTSGLVWRVWRAEPPLGGSRAQVGLRFLRRPNCHC